MQRPSERSTERNHAASPRPVWSVALFGRHPAWDGRIEDSTDDVGLSNPAAATVCRMLDDQAIGPNITSGVWDRLANPQRLPGFGHLFAVRLGAAAGRTLVIGSLWHGGQARGRSRHPMAACVVCPDSATVMLPRSALTKVLPVLTRLAERCRGAETRAAVGNALRSAARHVNEHHGAAPGTGLGVESRADPRAIQRLIEHAALAGADEDARRPLLRVLHAIECGAGSVLSGTPAEIARHVRVPRCGVRDLEAARQWMALMAQEAPPSAPIMVLEPRDQGFVDIIIGEPAASTAFCLLASEAALPLTTAEQDVDEVTEPFESATMKRISAWARGETAGPPARVVERAEVHPPLAPASTADAPIGSAATGVAPAPRRELTRSAHRHSISVRRRGRRVVMALVLALIACAGAAGFRGYMRKDSGRPSPPAGAGLLMLAPTRAEAGVLEGAATAAALDDLRHALGSADASRANGIWNELAARGWPRLEELDKAAALAPIVQQAASHAGGEAGGEAVASLCREMWARAARDVRDVADLQRVMACAGAMGVSEKELEAMPPWWRANLARVQFMEALDSGDGAVMAAAARFVAATKLLKRPDGATQAILVQANGFIGRISGPEGIGFRARPREPGSPSTTFDFPSRPGDRPRSLTFARTDDERRRASYLATTELSVGECVAILDAAEGWDEFRAVVGRPEPAEGVRTWRWVSTSAGDRIRPQVPAGDIMAPGDPWDLPMQGLPPRAAAWIAEVAGCRLPTAHEWSAAVAQAKRNGGLGLCNLRDASWLRGVRDWRLGRGGMTVGPGIGVFGLGPTDAMNSGWEGRRDAIDPGAPDDGWLWFAPVTGSGAAFHHLIGNVAEYVRIGVPGDDAGTSEMIGDIGVVGGSALAAADPAPEVVRAIGAVGLMSAYADVGLRLAFDAQVGGGNAAPGRNGSTLGADGAGVDGRSNREELRRALSGAAWIGPED